MKSNKVWITGFILSFLSIILVIAYRLGWLNLFSYGVHNYKKAKQQLISEVVSQTFPDFQVYTENGDSLGISEVMDEKINLILFLGPGCIPCNSQVIETVAEFHKVNHEPKIVALVYKGEHEFVHLRTLAETKFKGLVAKFSSTNKFVIPTFPSVYLFDKESRKIVDVFFPDANRIEDFQDFLKNVTEHTHRSYPQKVTPQFAANRDYSRKRVETINQMFSRKKEQLTLVKRIKLEYNSESLISDVRAFEIGKDGEIFIGHSSGQKVTIFGSEGNYMKTLTVEDIYGPGRTNADCSRIFSVGKSQVGFLFIGFVTDLPLYDLQKSEFSFMPLNNVTTDLIFVPELRKKRLPRNSPVLDATFVDDDHVYLLSFPQRVLGQEGSPQVFELENNTIVNSFAAFPNLRYPNFSQRYAPQRARIIWYDNILYTYCPLENRIYRFDATGNRLDDLVYPMGFINQPDGDAPNDPREWHKYEIGNADLFNGIFPTKIENKAYVIIARQRDRSFFLDVFDDKDMLTESIEITGYFEENRIAEHNGHFYGYMWPEVGVQRFEVTGNPEVVIYSLK